MATDIYETVRNLQKQIAARNTAWGLIHKEVELALEKHYEGCEKDAEKILEGLLKIIENN